MEREICRSIGTRSASLESGKMRPATTDQQDNTSLYVGDERLARLALYLYILLRVWRHCEDTKWGICNRISVLQCDVRESRTPVQLERIKGNAPRDSYLMRWNRFRDDRFVPTFHWIFGLRDANPLESLFDFCVWPLISYSFDDGIYFNWDNRSDFTRMMSVDSPFCGAITRTWIRNDNAAVIHRGDGFFP